MAQRILAPTGDHPSGHIMDGDESGGRGAACDECSEDNEGSQSQKPQPADILSAVNTAEPHRSRLGNHVLGENALSIPPGSVGGEALARKAAGRALERSLLFA